MAADEQLGDDSRWYVRLAAIWPIVAFDLCTGECVS